MDVNREDAFYLARCDSRYQSGWQRFVSAPTGRLVVGNSVDTEISHFQLNLAESNFTGPMCISGLMHSIPGGPSDELYLHGIILAATPPPPLAPLTHWSILSFRPFNPASNYTCSTTIGPLAQVIIILLSYQRYCHSWTHTTIALFEVLGLMRIDQEESPTSTSSRSSFEGGRETKEEIRQWLCICQLTISGGSNGIVLYTINS